MARARLAYPLLLLTTHCFFSVLAVELRTDIPSLWTNDVPKCFVPKLVQSGKLAELTCFEDEGLPDSQYQWFKNKEEIPVDPNTNPNFSSSSYTLDTQTGTLTFTMVRKEDEGEYFCRANNDAGQAECLPQKMLVYVLDFCILLGMLLVVTVVLCITLVLCCVSKKGKKQRGNNYKDPANGDEMVNLRIVEEGDF